MIFLYLVNGFEFREALVDLMLIDAKEPSLRWF